MHRENMPSAICHLLSAVTSAYLYTVPFIPLEDGGGAMIGPTSCYLFLKILKLHGYPLVLAYGCHLPNDPDPWVLTETIAGCVRYQA
jgi:hypothetical protein